MLTTDANQSLALILARMLAEVCHLGDKAAQTAKLQGVGDKARVTVDPEAWARYRTKTIRAGLGAFGLPGPVNRRNN